MNWSAFLQAARVRAVEEADAEGRVWDPETRRSATRSAGLQAQKTGKTSSAFLSLRSAILAAAAKIGHLLPSLKVPAIPALLIPAGWVGAFLIGWWLAAFGQGHEINLLSLPLLAILLWNAVVVLWSLVSGYSKSKVSREDEGLIAQLLQRLRRRAQRGVPADPVSVASAQRFQELAWPVACDRFVFRFRAWLHIAAALLALGTISGMYARGWSKEYHAVWESTLLDESDATKFFRTLFAPASIVTGQAIPLDQVPGMRRHPDKKAVAPGDALPWIHLYAATLGLFALVPRVLLTALELGRARAVLQRACHSRAWQEYADRLRSLVDGKGAPALVLTHGLTQDAAAQDRWRHWAYLHWRDVGQLAFDDVPLGREAEFVNEWVPATSRVMLVFNMAATPEAEVQRSLVDALVKKLKGDKREGATLLLALDDSDLRRRWAGFGDLPQRLAERTSVWSEAMSRLDVIWHEMVMPAKHAK